MAKVITLSCSIVYHIEVIVPLWHDADEEVIAPDPRRVIAIPSDYSLYDLGSIVLDVLDFDNDHHFGFYDNLTRWTKSKVAYVAPEMIPEDDFLEGFRTISAHKRTQEYSMDDYIIADIFPRKGKKWLMLFDYGDEWYFQLKLIDKQPLDIKKKYPQLLISEHPNPKQYPDYDED